MRFLLPLLFSLLPLGLPLGLQAQVMASGYAFDTVPGMSNGAAYAQIQNMGDTNLMLIGASSGVAETVQLHTHILDGEVKRMVMVEEPLMIQAGETLTMAPGGVHIMLIGLNAPLSVGDMFTLTLEFEGFSQDMRVMVHSVEDAEMLTGGADTFGDGGDEGHAGHDMDSHDHMDGMSPDKDMQEQMDEKMGKDTDGDAHKHDGHNH